MLSEATDAYFIGKLSSMDGLPFVGRIFVKYLCLPLERYAFRKWGWSCNPQGQAICRTEGQATRMCEEKPRWFWLRLPIDRSLPEETVRYGHDFPASDAHSMYEKLNPQITSEAVVQAQRARHKLQQTLDTLT